MFITSQTLKDRIKEISQVIEEMTNHQVYFEEYIALPYHGQIVLRFNLRQEDYTLEDLDTYENMIFEIVKDEFLIDFMGSVYTKVGLKLQDLDGINQKCYEKFKTEQSQPSIYQQKLLEDSKELLRLCHLDENLDVWEIQVEDELSLLIMKDEFKELGTHFNQEMIVHAYEVKREPCLGCAKAFFHAKRMHQSFVRILLEVQE